MEYIYILTHKSSGNQKAFLSRATALEYANSMLINELECSEEDAKDELLDLDTFTESTIYVLKRFELVREV